MNRSIRLRPIFVAVATLLSSLVLVLLAPRLIHLIEQVNPLGVENQNRIYLMVALSCVVVSLLFVLTDRTLSARHQLIPIGLLVAIFPVMCILVVEETRLTDEVSSLTFLTGMALVLASAAAFLNFLNQAFGNSPSRPRSLFWAALSLVFLFGGIDETMMVHEKIARFLAGATSHSAWRNQFQDGVTGLYALGGLVFLAFVLGPLRRHLIGNLRLFPRLFMAAAITFAISAGLDSFSFLAESVSYRLDLPFMANMVEEILEFLAATLFFQAGLAALLESRDLGLFDGLQRLAERSLPAHRLWDVSFTLGALGLAGATVASLFLAPSLDSEIIEETDRFSVEVLATGNSGFERADGIAYFEGVLFVANDKTSSVSRLDRDGLRPVEIDNSPLVTPESIAAAADGAIYLSDDTTNSVYILRGQRLDVLLDESDGLRSPKGMEPDGRGGIFIADPEATAVFHYSARGLRLYASSLQGLRTPEEIAIDESGALYVTDEPGRRVTRIDAQLRSSTYFDESDGLGIPEGIVASGGSLYVTDSLKCAVFRIDAEGVGEKILTFTPRYCRLEGIDADETGALYVTVRNPLPLHSQILKITPRQMVSERVTTSGSPP